MPQGWRRLAESARPFGLQEQRVQGLGQSQEWPWRSGCPRIRRVGLGPRVELAQASGWERPQVAGRQWWTESAKQLGRDVFGEELPKDGSGCGWDNGSWQTM